MRSTMQIDGAQQNADNWSMSDVDKIRAEQRRQQLRKFIAKKGLKLRAWARDADLKSDGTIRNFLDGNTKSMTQETVSKLAHAAGVPVSEIFPDTTDRSSNAAGNSTVARTNQKDIASHDGDKRNDEITELAERILVIGETQSGAWREAIQFDESERPPMYLEPDADYPGFPRFALINRGESMNCVCEDGGRWIFIRFVDLEENGINPKHNDLVIAQRARHDLYETSCKWLEVRDGERWLVPDSRSSGFSPIRLTDDMEIIGLVVDVVNKPKRRR